MHLGQPSLEHAIETHPIDAAPLAAPVEPFEQHPTHAVDIGPQAAAVAAHAVVGQMPLQVTPGVVHHGLAATWAQLSQSLSDFLELAGHTAALRLAAHHKVVAPTKGSGLAIMHLTPNLLKGIPTRFGFNIVFLLLFSQQKGPLPHVLRAQAAPVFVAFSRFPSVHHSRKLSFPTCCTGPSKNSAIRRCLVLISQWKKGPGSN